MELEKQGNRSFLQENHLRCVIFYLPWSKNEMFSPKTLLIMTLPIKNRHKLGCFPVSDPK